MIAQGDGVGQPDTGKRLTLAVEDLHLVAAQRVHLANGVALQLGHAQAQRTTGRGSPGAVAWLTSNVPGGSCTSRRPSLPSRSTGVGLVLPLSNEEESVWVMGCMVGCSAGGSRLP